MAFRGVCYRRRASLELNIACIDVLDPTKRRACNVHQRRLRFKELNRGLGAFRRPPPSVSRAVIESCTEYTGRERGECMRTRAREEETPRSIHPLFNPRFSERGRVRRAVRDCKIYTGPERVACIHKPECRGLRGYARYTCTRDAAEKLYQQSPGISLFMRSLALPVAITPQEIRHQLFRCDRMVGDEQLACRKEVYEWIKRGGEAENGEEEPSS